MAQLYLYLFITVIIIYGCLLYSVVYPLILLFDLFDHEEGVRIFFFNISNFYQFNLVQ
jgi:hypothetical protein